MNEILKHELMVHADALHYIKTHSSGIDQERQRLGMMVDTVKEHCRCATGEATAYKLGQAIGLPVKSFNRVIAEASEMATPQPLFMDFWYEGELTALYADTNLGKSILSVQIAEHIALSGRKVLYCDLELTDKGFEMRCRDLDGGTVHRFPDNLFRMGYNELRFDTIFSKPDADGTMFLDCLELIGKQLGVSVLILDNISVISQGLDSGLHAIKLVKRLLRMRNDNGWSILFIAHTTKTDRRTPIGSDEMSGSKRIMNLIDSAFSIGASLTEPRLRYLKQTKVRLKGYKYDAENVLVCEIKRVDGLLTYQPVGTQSEAVMLQTAQEKRRAELVAEVQRLTGQGLSPKEIADVMAMSVNSIRAMLK